MTEIAANKLAGAGVDEELLAEAQRHLGGASEADALNAALLEQVKRQLGGASEVEAVNAALLEYVKGWRERRGRAYDRLQAIADEGGFDFAAIDEADR